MIKTIQSILIVVFLLGLSSISFAQSSLRQADKLFEIHSYDKAIPVYKKVIAKQPSNVAALSKLGHIYFYYNRLDEAKGYFKKVIQYGNLSVNDLKVYGQVLMSLGEYSSAKHWFDTYKEAYLLEGAQYAKSCEIATFRKDKQGDFKISKEFVNGPDDDNYAAFLNDKVVFSSSRQKLGDKSWSAGDNSLWISERDNNIFLRIAKTYGSSVSKHNNVGPVAFSTDGKYVAYTKNNFKNGLKHIVPGNETSIFIAEVLPNGSWINDKAFPFNSNSYSVGFPNFSKDGKTLFFASNRPDGLGGYDIYASQKVNNIWQYPENLGAPINTPGNEITPFFDGSSLFFSSDWHFGFGGLDVFRIEGSMNKWGRLYSLGWGVNSSRDDYAFIFDGNRNLGYLSSNRNGGNGKGDLYRVLADNKSIEFVVRDGRGIPVKNVLIDFGPCASVGKTDQLGRYKVNLAGSVNCTVIFSKVGYETVSTNLPPSGGVIDISMKEVLTQPIAQGIVLNSNNTGISHVQVLAKNERTEEIQVITTNLGGNYSFPISYDKYTLTVKKNGFVTKILNFTALSSKGKKIALSAIVLENEASVVTSSPAPTPRPTKPKVKPTKAKQTIPAGGLEGYAVQVAALPKSNKPNISKFDKLKAIDVIYVIEEGAYSKVRLGPYSNKKAAQVAAKKVKKMGFSSFVVKDTYFPKIADAQAKSSNPTESFAGEGDYFIRLAAYKSLKWFDPSKILHLGKVKTERKGDWKIKYIGSFNSPSSATSKLSLVKKAGFENAYVVKKVGVTYEKI